MRFARLLMLLVPMGALLTGSLLGLSPAAAVPCGSQFDAWLEAFKSEAATKGISQATIASALTGVTPNPQVLALDRKQGVFQQSYEKFGPPRIAQRLTKGQHMMLQYGSLLSRIEKRFGVPGSVLVAIWGLETDFGVNMGHEPVIRALVTLAFDCRRTDKFQAELLDALRIVDRGDLKPADMRGAWAGELGQTQFLPSSYVKFAVDFDDNGRRDLIRSVPDVLASTANYLKSHGWTPGQGWAEGSKNFEVLGQWNESTVYRKTIAAFASQLGGE